MHDIKRGDAETSAVNKLNIAKTCGKCHVKVEETYNQSVHGRLLAKGDKRAPVCTDCHTAHEIEPPGNGWFKMASDRRCGRCHGDRLEHYRDTYHGKAMALGKPNVAADVAACYDCHGHHDVLPVSNPASRLSSGNIVQTCQQCHPGATASFTKYDPHANPLDRKNYPVLHATFVFMTSLLIGVFAFFGAHTALWVFRSVYLYYKDTKTFREAKAATHRDTEMFSRFAPFHRFLHFLVVTSFLLLVLTGMPLKFYDSAWPRRFSISSVEWVWRACSTTSARWSRSSTSACTWRSWPSPPGRIAATCATRPRAISRSSAYGASSSVRTHDPHLPGLA